MSDVNTDPPGSSSEHAFRYSLLVHNAVLITSDPIKPPAFRGWFTVDRDGRLAHVADGDPDPGLCAERTIDAEGALVGPGFVSSHSHLFSSPSRGLGTHLSLYGWIEANNVYANIADADDIYWFTRHGAQDFLRNGVTTAYDYAHSRAGLTLNANGIPELDVHAVPDLDYQHAQIRAKVDAGLRHIHSVTLGQGDSATALAAFNDVVALAGEFRPDASHLGLAISGAVQWADSAHAAGIEVTAMREHGLINQPHFLETPVRVADQQARFDWYRDAGALGPDLIFGHFIHVTDPILDAAADAGCGMSWQPMSNGRLASGVPRIPQMRDRGIRIGVGLDDQSCTDISDPFSNMRTGIGMLRATYLDPAVMPVAEMLTLHTRGSAEILGIESHVGSLRTGRYADFLIVDPRNPDTGPVWDPVATYVLACGLQNLREVWVGGQQIAHQGKLLQDCSHTVSVETHQRMATLSERIRSQQSRHALPHR